MDENNKENLLDSIDDRIESVQFDIDYKEDKNFRKMVEVYSNEFNH